MSYGDILAVLRKESGLTQPEVAEHLSEYSEKPCTYKAVSHWEKGVAFPSIEHFLLLCELYKVEDIQATFRGLKTEYRYLSKLNALGRSKAEDYISVLSGNPLFSENERESDDTARRIIKLYDLPASAGYGSFLDSDSYTEIEIDKTVPDGADYAVRVSGDSMTPRFVDGQVVFVKEKRNIEVGEIGIFALNNESFMKKLGRGELLSLNSEYPPIPLKEFDSIYVLGEVLG